MGPTLSFLHLRPTLLVSLSMHLGCSLAFSHMHFISVGISLIVTETLVFALKGYGREGNS